MLMMKKGLGSIIRKHRILHELTCKQLAQKVGVDRSYIGKIENLNILPAYHILVKLEAILGINLKGLYSKEKKVAPDFLIADSSSGYTIIEPKSPPGITQAELFHQLNNYVIGIKNKEAPQKVACLIIQDIAPSKVNDKQLQDDLAAIIRTLRKVYPTLVGQGR